MKKQNGLEQIPKLNFLYSTILSIVEEELSDLPKEFKKLVKKEIDRRRDLSRILFLYMGANLVIDDRFFRTGAAIELFLLAIDLREEILYFESSGKKYRKEHVAKVALSSNLLCRSTKIIMDIDPQAFYSAISTVLTNSAAEINFLYRLMKNEKVNSNDYIEILKKAGFAYVLSFQFGRILNQNQKKIDESQMIEACESFSVFHNICKEIENLKSRKPDILKENKIHLTMMLALENQNKPLADAKFKTTEDHLLFIQENSGFDMAAMVAHRYLSKSIEVLSEILSTDSKNETIKILEILEQYEL